LRIRMTNPPKGSESKTAWEEAVWNRRIIFSWVKARWKLRTVVPGVQSGPHAPHRLKNSSPL